MTYIPSEDRYQNMVYNRCGRSGIHLPAISLGLWQNFGSVNDFENARTIIHTAFDKGIMHFDLANNYGPANGTAEENFGKILQQDFTGNLRDELFISTKAGYTMWPGPYGDWGSRKYLISSLDQSLKRMQLDYVDVFYAHRPDPGTPLEETMGALDTIVRSGRALYAGISNYREPEAEMAIDILKQLGTPCIIHQPKYSMFERWVEDGLLDTLDTAGVGCIAFSPLAQGLLTSKYLDGVPGDSRAARQASLKLTDITEKRVTQIAALNAIAKERNQSLAQMALAWLLKDKRITAVLIGASSAAQLQENIACLDNLHFSAGELAAIDMLLRQG
jgi:L-glyceraldehyde 3-phosphate reductase